MRRSGSAIGPGSTIRGVGLTGPSVGIDRYSAVWAVLSGSGRREARIHTSWAVVSAPTLDRAFARWCFTVGPS